MTGRAWFLSRAGDAPGWDLFFDRPAWVARTWRAEAVPRLLDQGQARLRQGQWLVLALAYEAAAAFDSHLAVHPPATPLLYAAAYPGPAAPPSLPARPYRASPWRPLVSRRDYGRAVAAVRENIRLGEAYQVNYTFPMACRFRGDPASWFLDLAGRQAAGYGALVELGRLTLLSLSPELFFARAGDAVRVKPMKGTLPRGRTPAEDRRMASILAGCEKNRAENRMITDLMRNDLGRLAKPGSVAVPELFAVERYGALWQMTSTVTAGLTPGISLGGLLAALFPCGSVTGAPKVAAMRLIREVEPHPRGFYTGAIGYVAPGGDCVFNVAIRTVTLDTVTGEARFGVGGGLTHYSEAGDEYEECRVKAAFLSARPDPFCLLETLRLQNGRFILLSEHLARLAASAGYFGFRHDPATVAAALEALRREHPAGAFRVRLLLAADGGVRTEALPLTRSLPRPLRLTLGPAPVDSSDVFLFHKTTRREVFKRAMAARPESDDVLLVNERGEVTESCRANLVLDLEGRLYTPEAACGLLPGTYRERLLARGILHERVIRPADLTRARRIWLINSVRLFMPAVLAEPPRSPALDAGSRIC